jgi:putative oxidoreductase
MSWIREVTVDSDLAALLLRAALGAVMVAHGWNHLFGAGGVAGTARWFASMGLRPPKVHALASGSLELLAGSALLLGLFTALQCAAVVGVMTVALVVAHRRNGFFIFRPGQGWEYVAVLIVTAVALAVLGPGAWSLDARLDIADDLDEEVGLTICGLGAFAAAAMLAMCWRPGAPEDPDTTTRLVDSSVTP